MRQTDLRGHLDDTASSPSGNRVFSGYQTSP